MNKPRATIPWPRVRLGEVLALSDTAVPSGHLTEVNLAGVYSFGRGLFARGAMSPGKTSYKSYNRLVTDDFVISQPKAWEGALARVTAEFDGWYLSPVFSTFRVNRIRIEPAFLEWFCKRVTVWSELLRGSRGIGARRETVSPETFLALEIPLPPLSEQRRIVARIEELAAKLTETRTLQQEVDEEAKVLWQRGAERVFDEVSETSPIRVLRECVEIRGGGTPSKANPLLWQGNIPWISPKDMKSRVILDAADHISEEATIESAAKVIPSGAVLVVVRGMILVHTFPSAVLRVPASINQDMKALLPKPGIESEFLCSFFWAHNRRILGLVEKSSHDTRKMVTPKLLEIAVPIPPPTVQRRIVAELDVLQAKVDEVKKLQAETQAELDALLPSILDRAFKGEL